MICTLSLPDSSWISKLHSCWAVRSSASSVISTVALFFWYLPLSSRCFCNLKEFFRLLSCRYDNFGMLALLLVKCLPRMSFMELVVSKMQCMKPEMKPETKTWNHKDKGDSNKTKKNSNRTIFKPEMTYLQVCTRTCSTFLISHHTNPAKFLLHSNFFLIQLLQKIKINKSNLITMRCQSGQNYFPPRGFNFLIFSRARI